MASRDLPTARAFNRDEASAILRRAIEVASDGDIDRTDGLSSEHLAEVADEVGVPPAALATALAEARVGVGLRRNLADRLVGPSKVWANVRVAGDGHDPVGTLQRWLEVDHGLTTYVRDDGVVVASPKGGVAGAVGAGVRKLQGTGGLNRARWVRAAAVEVDADGAVCVVADVGNRRTEAIAGGTVVAGGSMAAVGIAAVAAGPLALIGLPVAAALGVGTARLAHRRTVVQVTDLVEQTTHAVARAQDPVHPVERLLRSGLPGRRRSRDR